MTRKNFLTAVFLLAGALPALSGQTTAANFVSSTYSVGSQNIGTKMFSLSVSVYYSDGLAPNQYVDSAQLSSDIVGFLNAYSAPNDPPEAILSSALGSLLRKYTQISGGALNASTFSIASSTSSSIEVVKGALAGITGFGGAIAHTPAGTNRK